MPHLRLPTSVPTFRFAYQAGQFRDAFWTACPAGNYAGQADGVPGCGRQGWGIPEHCGWATTPVVLPRTTYAGCCPSHPGHCRRGSPMGHPPSPRHAQRDRHLPASSGRQHVNSFLRHFMPLGEQQRRTPRHCSSMASWRKPPFLNSTTGRTPLVAFARDVPRCVWLVNSTRHPAPFHGAREGHPGGLHAGCSYPCMCTLQTERVQTFTPLGPSQAHPPPPWALQLPQA